MPKKRSCGLALVLLLLSAYSAAQDKPLDRKGSLPKVVSAFVPFYPELARQTHIQGPVTLRVSTDGKRVSAVEAENGHRLLETAAMENAKTWQFEPHVPATFDVTFRYKLLDAKCDPECNCEGVERESVILQLPTNVEVSAVVVILCDPAVEIRGPIKKKSLAN